VTVGEFLERAGRLLLADEARHNLILGIAGTIADHPDVYPDAAFWAVAGAAALRTRPVQPRPGPTRDERALRELAAAIDDVPGVSEATPEAYDFARVWGRPFRLVMEQNVFALEQVIEPPTRDRRATSR
jgi:hypothetical protein